MSSTIEQSAVFAKPSENKLVCSLAGSGKTYTTVKLAEKATQDERSTVLMVTFTNSAMKEIDKRISSELPYSQASRVHVKTFAKIMLEQFKILDPSKQVIMGGQLTNYYYRVAKKLNVDYSELPEYEASMELIGRSPEMPDVPKNHIAFYNEVQKTLQQYNRIDLNTVAKRVVAALQDKTLAPLPYTFFIIDEYQDTDSQQYLWLLAQKDDDKYFCVVGDDDQSIYSWRGARAYQNMIQFQKEFNATGYLLSTCFRCSPLILGLAQKLIEHNEERIPKNMSSFKEELGSVTSLITPEDYKSPFTEMLKQYSLVNTSISPPKFVSETTLETYRHIVDSIENDYAGLAILCRTNKHLDGLEYCLSERGIPYVRMGGKSIFDNPHAIGLCNLLIAFVYPNKKRMLIEGLSWLGISDEILNFVNYQPPTTKLLDIASNQSDVHVLTQLTSLRHRCLNNKPEASLILSELSRLLETHFSDTEDKLSVYRMATIQTVIGILQKQKGSFGVRINTLNGMLMSTDNKKDHRNETKVTLCTKTSSKGLEWPKVLLMMINSSVIPSVKSGSLAHNDEDTKAQRKAKQKIIEEERRLLYVAITRAENSLIIHYNEESPSMFIQELGHQKSFNASTDPLVADAIK